MTTRVRRIGVGVTIAGLTVAFAGVFAAWRIAQSNQGANHAADGSPRVPSARPIRGPAEKGLPSTITESWLEQTCSRCHRVPPPDAFARAAWKPALSHMLITAGVNNPEAIGIPVDAVTRWYEQLAPDELPLAPIVSADGPGSLKLNYHEFSMRDFRMFQPAANPAARPSPPAHTLALAPSVPGVSNVRFLDLVDDPRLELVVCDMWNGLVLMGRPYEDSGDLETLARVPFPAHAELVDLDRDGTRDLVVADLGSLMPADHQNGGVVWLRNRGERGFESATLLTGVGRVADTRAADFDADGDIDLIVAEFGWQATGRIFLLENQTDDWNHPSFERHLIDPRHGTIHVPIRDLDGDGRPDFVALISQEHEVVVAFLNRGGFQFEPHEIYRAPHPAWGSSGLELVDLDGDSDLDMLLTNGDSSDLLPKLRPYHGITWLENIGFPERRSDASFPHFVPHALSPMYGVHRAEAADLDQDGDLDIVACSFIPLLHASGEDQRVELESVVWLEQTEPGQFARHALELRHCDHATLALGDYDLDGDIDMAIGNYVFEQFGMPEKRPWVGLWENRITRIEPRNSDPP